MALLTLEYIVKSSCRKTEHIYSSPKPRNYKNLHLNLLQPLSHACTARYLRLPGQKQKFLRTHWEIITRDSTPNLRDHVVLVFNVQSQKRNNFQVPRKSDKSLVIYYKERIRTSLSWTYRFQFISKNIFLIYNNPLFLKKKGT